MFSAGIILVYSKRSVASGLPPWSNDNELLIVKQRGGKWGFPKGHATSTETPFQCSMRELNEETGIYLPCECTLVQGPDRDGSVRISDIMFFVFVVHHKPPQCVSIDYREIECTSWCSYDLLLNHKIRRTCNRTISIASLITVRNQYVKKSQNNWTCYSNYPSTPINSRNAFYTEFDASSQQRERPSQHRPRQRPRQQPRQRPLQRHQQSTDQSDWTHKKRQRRRSPKPAWSAWSSSSRKEYRSYSERHNKWHFDPDQRSPQQCHIRSSVSKRE